MLQLVVVIRWMLAGVSDKQNYVGQELERAVGFELTITGFAAQCLWPDLATRATVARYASVLSLTPRKHPPNHNDKLKHIGHDLEREERFELSKRIWKTRMFPATSLPQNILTIGALDRSRTHT